MIVGALNIMLEAPVGLRMVKARNVINGLEALLRLGWLWGLCILDWKPCRGKGRYRKRLLPKFLLASR